MSEITSTQIKMLKKLYKHDGLILEELKKYIDIDKHTEAFNELFMFGLVKFYDEPIIISEDNITNERRYYITPTGKKLLRLYKDKSNEDLKKLLISKWSDIIVSAIVAYITCLITS